jgi:hypothetical protein
MSFTRLGPRGGLRAIRAIVEAIGLGVEYQEGL